MLKEKVLQTIKKYHLIEKNDHIVLGVSGGPDSTCLFSLFLELQKEIGFTFVVCHLNHGIREEAETEEEYVRKLCEENHIPCYVKKEKVLEKAKQERIGTEEMGRKVRYAFFEEIANKEQANKIATAHTKNDLVETTIMNILRGVGLSGLKGILPIRENRYIRPLIECERGEIEQYCNEQKLEPKIDQSNFDNHYTRNKVRNQLIPYLKEEYNPNIVEAMARMASIIRKEDEYIDGEVEKAYQEIVLEERETEIILDLKSFNELNEVIKNRMVLYSVRQLFGSSAGIEKKHIEDIILLCRRNIGNKFLIPNKKVKILVKNQKIFFIKNQ